MKRNKIIVYMPELIFRFHILKLFYKYRKINIIFFREKRYTTYLIYIIILKIFGTKISIYKNKSFFSSHKKLFFHTENKFHEKFKTFNSKFLKDEEGNNFFYYIYTHYYQKYFKDLLVYEFFSIKRNHNILLLMEENIFLKHYIENNDKIIFYKKNKPLFKKLFKKIKDLVIYTKPYKKENKISIAIKMNEGTSRKKRSDDFWLNNSIKEKYNIIYYDQYPSKFFKKFSFLNSHYLEFILLYLLYRPKQSLQLNANTSKKFALNKEYTYYLKRLLFWKLYFKFHKVRIHFSLDVPNPEYVIQYKALSDLKGIRISCQRSFFSQTNHMPAMTFNANHLYFLWGKDAKYINNISNNIQHFIISGYPFKIMDYYPDRKFSIAIYDNVYNHFLYFSEYDLLFFYKKLLQLCYEHDDIYLKIKPKKNLNIFDHRMLKPLYDDLYKSRKIEIPVDYHGMLPSDISYNASIAIGFGISTAAVESFLQGCPSLLYDVSKTYDHYLYKHGKDRFIFSDLDTLINSILKFKNRQSEIGDWSNIAEVIDPFRDNNGCQRIAEYIGDVARLLSEGITSRAALQRASEVYASKYGKDKILNL